MQAGHPLLKDKRVNEWYIDTERVPIEVINFVKPYIKMYHTGRCFLFYKPAKEMESLCQS